MVPIIDEATAEPERQFQNVAGDEELIDIEFGLPSVGALVVSVLRILDSAGVESRAAAAGRNVIGRAGQRLAPRVTDKARQAFGESFLQTRLQRVVGGPDAVLHPLNVA